MSGMRRWRTDIDHAAFSNCNDPERESENVRTERKAGE